MLRKWCIPISFIFLLIEYSSVGAQTVTASFSSVDTVCVNTPVIITNTSTANSSSTFYWSFCSGSATSTPTGTLLGNVGNKFAVPVFADYANDNGNYYAFVVNNSPGGLIRLNFGNSLLNTPTATDLGNFAGNIPNSAQGIQVVQSNGRWYAIVVGGDPAIGISSRILKLDFGSSLANTPTVTNWGNVGNMNYPVDIYIFQQGTIWYGLTVNYRDNSMTRFQFGTDFTGTPTGVNYGVLGGMNLPSGICPINDNGTWRVFVANFGNNTLSRIDFGNSLSNPPSSSVNLGNPNGILNTPRDLYIFNNCGSIVGFIVNDNSGDIVRMNFNSLSATPTLTSLGQIGGASNPHSMSKIFRVNGDLYSFLPNSYTNTLSRINFAGCTNASAASSTSITPPSVSYNSPGTYTISLTVDEGTINQSSACKQVVVMGPQNLGLPSSYETCAGTGVQMNVQNAQVFQWAPAGGLSSTTIANPMAAPAVSTVYSLTVTDNSKCVQTASVAVNVNPLPSVTVSKSRDLNCATDTIQLTAAGGVSYTWSPTYGLSNYNVANPLVTGINTNTTYAVTAVSAKSCAASATITVAVVSVLPAITISKSADLQCSSDTIQISASGAATYQWYPSTGLSNPNIANPLVTGLAANTTYSVIGTSAAGCSTGVSNAASVMVAVLNNFPIVVVNKSADLDCSSDTIQLNSSGGAKYTWTPSTGLSDPFIPNPKLTGISTSTVYSVTVTSTRSCAASSSIPVNVLGKYPTISITKSADIECPSDTIQLSATGGVKYIWSPVTNLSNPYISNPLVSGIVANTTYQVTVFSSKNCAATDSIAVALVNANSNSTRYLVPNAFTPNGDGLNDCFGVPAIWGALKKAELSIYNRWGQVIFYATDRKKCWDGKLNGIEQQTGTYVYIIRATSGCETFERHGEIRLIR